MHWDVEVGCWKEVVWEGPPPGRRHIQTITALRVLRLVDPVGGSAAAKLAPAHRAVPAVVYDTRLLNMVRQVGVAGASEFGEAVWALFNKAVKVLLNPV